MFLLIYIFAFLGLQVLNIAVLLILPCVAISGIIKHSLYALGDDDIAEPLPEIKSYVPWAKIIRIKHTDTNPAHKIYRVIQDDFLPADKPSFYKIVQLKSKANILHLPQPGPIHLVSHKGKKW